MKCPYCAEDIKDEAVVCKHCTRDLIFVRPLLDRLDQLQKRVDGLEKNQAKGPASGFSGDQFVPAALSAAVVTATRIDRAVPLLSPFAALALTFILLVVAHFLIIVQFDLSLIYLRLVSIVVPGVFGFLYRGASRPNLMSDFGAGLAVAILSIFTMSAIVAKIDHVPVLPTDANSWRELAEYGASITFAFFTGVIARHGLASLQSTSTSLGSNRFIGLVSKYIAMKMRPEGEEVEDDAMEKRLKSLESMVSSAIAMGSAVISVATGLYQFIH